MNLLLLCSHSPNDVPREPQRNVSIAAVRGVGRSSNKMNLCMCVYSNSRNDVPRVAQRYGTIAAHTRSRASVLVVFVVFCVHMHSFAGLIRRTPPPTFSDTAITDRHSDTTIFQLRAHMHSFAGLMRRAPPPTFSDTAITDGHSDTTIFQLTECGYHGLLDRKNRLDMCPRWESNPRLPSCKASTLSTRPGSPLKMNLTIELIFIYSGDDGLSALANQIQV